MRMKLAVHAMLVAFGTATAVSPVAAEYPERPVRFVVPFPPGGNTDILARMVANGLSARWGQQLLVDNRAGAAGSIGTALVAKAPADGYTILLGTIGSIGINPTLYRKLPYQPLRDLAPVSQITANPLVVMLHPSVPARTVKELVALAKSKPDLLNYGSGGKGTSTHLSVELFMSMAKIRATHVPYRGAALASPALLAGEVSMLFDNLAPALPHVRAKRVRALAVTSAARTQALPDVPTVQESGLAGYEVSSWYGVLAPAGTPAGVLARIHADTVAVLKSPDVAERLRRDGADVVGSSPQGFTDFIKAEHAKWTGVVEQLGLKRD